MVSLSNFPLGYTYFTYFFGGRALGLVTSGITTKEGSIQKVLNIYSVIIYLEATSAPRSPAIILLIIVLIPTFKPKNAIIQANNAIVRVKNNLSCCIETQDINCNGSSI
jgi:hypothetical protein